MKVFGWEIILIRLGYLFKLQIFHNKLKIILKNKFIVLNTSILNLIKTNIYKFQLKKNLKHGLLFSQMEKKQKLLFRILEKIVSKQTIILLIFFSNQVRIIIFLIWDRQFKIRQILNLLFLWLLCFNMICKAFNILVVYKI